MSGLDPNAHAALQALGAARTPDATAVDRAWQQLQARIVDGPPPIAIDPTPVPRRRAVLVVAGLAVIAAAALLLAWSPWRAAVERNAAVEVAPYASEPTAPAIAVSPATPAASPSAAPSDGPSATDAPSVPSEIVEPASAEPTVLPSRVDRAPRRRVVPRVSEAPPAVEVETTPKTTTLAAEMKLLAQANAATRGGDAAAALAKLEAHRREFPDGQLAPEREVARAIALCELGRREAARAVVDAFVRAHAGSPLRAKAEGVCRE